MEEEDFTRRTLSAALCFTVIFLSLTSGFYWVILTVKIYSEPDGSSQIFFCRQVAYEDTPSRYETYIGVATETAAYMKLADLEGEAEFMPSASRDGSVLAYTVLPIVEFRPEVGRSWWAPSIDYGSTEIKVFYPASGKAAKATDNDWIELCPTVSPDGSRIVFSRSVDGGRTYSLVLKDLKTGRETRLTEGYTDIDPSFSPDGSRIAFASDRGGDGRFRIYILDLSAGLEVKPLEMYEEKRSELIYNFVGRASEAGWRSGAGALPFPGSDTDSRGFALYRMDAVLEDGSVWKKVLETHPEWVDNGYIEGIYPKQVGTAVYPGFTVPPGTQLKVRVGFLKGAVGTDGATFKVQFLDETQKLYTVLSHKASYDGRLDLITKNLDWLAGRTGRFILRVEAGPSSARDWAVWAEAELETSPTVKIDCEGVNPSWSPDGSKIAFTEKRSDVEGLKGLFRIRVASLSTGESKLVTEYPPPGFDYEMHPSWSPDGSRIVYEGVAELVFDHHGFHYSLWVVNVVSGRIDLLLDLGESVTRAPATPPGFPDYYGFSSSPHPYWATPLPGRITIIACDPLPDAVAGKSYTYRFDVIGGTPPYTVTVEGLPEGISYTDTTLTGSPSKPGAYTVTFRVKDSRGLTAEETRRLYVYSETTVGWEMRWPWPGDEYYVVTVAGKPFEFDLTETLYGGVPPYTVSYTRYSIRRYPLPIEEYTGHPRWASVNGGVISGTPSEDDAGEYSVEFEVSDAAGNTYRRYFTLYVLTSNPDHFDKLYPEVTWCGYVNETTLVVGGRLLEGLVTEYIFHEACSPLAILRLPSILYGRDIVRSASASLRITYRDGETVELRDDLIVDGVASECTPVPRSILFPTGTPPVNRVEGEYVYTLQTVGGQKATMEGSIVIYRSVYRAVHGFTFENFGTPRLNPELAVEYYGEDDFCVEEQLPDWLSFIFPAAAVVEAIGAIEGCVPDPIALLLLDRVYTRIGAGNCYGISLLSLRAREGRLYFYSRMRTEEAWSRDAIRAYEAPLDYPSWMEPNTLLNHWSTYVDGGGNSGSVRRLINTMQGANLDVDHLTYALNKIILGDWAVVAGYHAYRKPGWLVDRWARNVYEDVKSNLEERAELRSYAEIQSFESSGSYYPLLINMVPSLLEIADAHTVVAYDMIDTPSAAYILVYDSNDPFTPSDSNDGESSYILIDKSGEEWKWSFPGLGSDYGNGYIWAEPYPLVGHEDNPDFPSIDNIDEFLSYVPEGLGVLIAFIVDIAGGSAGIEQVAGSGGSTFYAEDGSLNLDPNTAVVGMVWAPPRLKPLDRSSDSKLYFLIRNDTYRFDVKGLKEGSYGFACTQGKLFILGTTSSEAESRDRFTLDPIGSSIGFTPFTGDKPVSFYVDRYLGRDGLKEIIVKDFKASTVGGVSITTDDDNRFITIRNLGPDTSFTVKFRRTSVEAVDEAVYEDVRIGEGETMRITPDWRKPREKPTVEVDLDSDGRWDKTVKLGEAPVLDQTPPKISKITITPEKPVWGDQVRLYVLVVDEESRVETVKLLYSVDGGATWRTLDAAPTGKDLYSYLIPSQPVGSEVLYYVEAVDTYGNTAKSPIESYGVGLPLWMIALIVATVILITSAIILRRR